MRQHGDVRIQRRQTRLCLLGFQQANAVGVEQHLTLQVRNIHTIIVDDAKRADAGRCQIQCRRRTEATGTDDEYPR